MAHSKRLVTSLIAVHTSTGLKLTRTRFTSTPLQFTHTPTCPANESTGSGPKRATKSGKVRMGFLPDEWFLFLHPKTGVSGPYLLGIVLFNYLFSKEIYVMEHEYYCALSILTMVYYASTRFGPEVGKILDKEVDAFTNALEKGRTDEKGIYETIIRDAKNAQRSANAQEVLMNAKRENIAMQLEAVYRERFMQVHAAVKGRMDYQVRLYRTMARLQQKWMIQWIIENVVKSITAEFEQAYLEKAIQDIASLAGRK